MAVPQKAIDAAVLGPEVKQVKISEINSAKEHEFNVKPLSMSVLINGTLIVQGQISHCINNWADDQYWFSFGKVGRFIYPDVPDFMILRSEKGGFITTVSKVWNFTKKIDFSFGRIITRVVELVVKDGIIDGISATASFPTTCGRPWCMDHEQAVLNFLNELSRQIQPPGLLTQTGLVLYEHDNFRGKQKLFMTDTNPTHLKHEDWNDKASSLQALVPDGMKLEVFEHDNYKGEKIEFISGSHYIRDLKIHGLGDKLTSYRWSLVPPNTVAPRLSTPIPRVARA